MKLLYFAWVREGIGLAEEQQEPPATVTTVGALLAWLRERGSPYAETLADESRLRVAVNQVHGGPQTPIAPGDEIAIFPPVTGG